MMMRNAFRNFRNIRAIDIILTARAGAPKRNSQFTRQQAACGNERCPGRDVFISPGGRLSNG